MQLNELVTSINSIGDQRQKYLNNMGIYTVADLIEHFPRDYDDRSDIKKICDLEENQVNTFIGKVEAEGSSVKVKAMTITRVSIKDETGKINCVWYNQPYIKNQFKMGMSFIFTGKLQKKYSRKEVVSPEYESLEKDTLLSNGRIIPIYTATKGLSQKILRSLINDTFHKVKYQMADFLPMDIRKENKLCDRSFAIENIHFPQNDDFFFIARYRLVFEELFILQTALLTLKQSINENKEGVIINGSEEEVISKLGFNLTNAQKRVVAEMKEDFLSGNVMNRLVQGDVGSGKTAIAIIGAFMAIKAGYQVALMAPTDVLAKQHFASFKSIFESFGITVTFLGGSQKKKEKTQSLEAIKDGMAQMIIGTHAVIQEGVEFKNLGFVITDEQHRFGVNQRITLSQKGYNPHILVMTATPIPRTLALILYGDLDISIIDELPPNRQKINTKCVNTSYRQRIYTFLKKEIDNGRQVYIVCATIEESEKNDKKEKETVLNYSERLIEFGFSAEEIGILHGKMKPAEKQSIMDRFLIGEIKILVATTVIEVGINVPNATVMIVENAEMFGLSQLHQLRGRVGRGSDQSYCILISDSKNKVTKERLNVMERTSDGFEISETDLKLRGAGEFFGTRQHGIPSLKIANLYKDIDILKKAQKAAQELIKKDKFLQLEQHQPLKTETERIFKSSDIGI